MIELVVERNPGETRIAVREDGRTVEVHLDRTGAASRVGTIHLARVTKAEAGIGAFLDIGEAMPAFLPLADETVVEGSTLPVQVAKDAVAGKGPEVTRTLVLDGGALALTPGQPGVAISRRLPDTLRKRLRARLKTLVGEARAGVLVRSSVRDDDDLEAIWRDLGEEWRKIEERLKAKPPLRLRPPSDPLVLAIRRLTPSRVVAGDTATTAKLRSIASVVEKIERPFEAMGIEDEISRALAREVAIPDGHLVIEEGETLTAIDVNGTGGRIALCLAAAREIGRLIRLRNLAGTLIIDFPLVEGKADRARLDAAMKAAVKNDPTGTDCLGWTRAGLYEMTRARTGRSLAAQILDQPASLPTVETTALVALRALSRAEGGRLKLVASSDVVAWLQDAGASALAEVGRPVALAAGPGYARERFDVVRD